MNACKRKGNLRKSLLSHLSLIGKSNDVAKGRSLRHEKPQTPSLNKKQGKPTEKSFNSSLSVFIHSLISINYCNFSLFLLWFHLLTLVPTSLHFMEASQNASFHTFTCLFLRSLIDVKSLRKSESWESRKADIDDHQTASFLFSTKKLHFQETIDICHETKCTPFSQLLSPPKSPSFNDIHHLYSRTHQQQKIHVQSYKPSKSMSAARISTTQHSPPVYSLFLFSSNSFRIFSRFLAVDSLKDLRTSC